MMNENERIVFKQSLKKKKKNKTETLCPTSDIYKLIHKNHCYIKNPLSSVLNEEQICTINKSKKKKSHKNHVNKSEFNNMQKQGHDNSIINHIKVRMNSKPLTLESNSKNQQIENEHKKDTHKFQKSQIFPNKHKNYRNKDNFKPLLTSTTYKNRSHPEEVNILKNGKNSTVFNIANSNTNVQLKLNISDAVINSDKSDLQNRNSILEKLNVTKKNKKSKINKLFTHTNDSGTNIKMELNSLDTPTNNQSYTNSDLQSENRSLEKAHVSKKKKKKNKSNDLFTHKRSELSTLNTVINSDQLYTNNDLPNQNRLSKEVNVLKKKEKKSNMDNLFTHESDSGIEIINSNQFCINNDESSGKQMPVLKKKKQRKRNQDDLLMDPTNSEKSELSTSNVILNDNKPEEMTILRKKKKPKTISDFGMNTQLELHSLETPINIDRSYTNSDLQSENRSSEKVHVTKRKKKKNKSNIDDLYTHKTDSEMNNLDVVKNSNQSYTNDNLLNQNKPSKEVNVLKKKKKKLSMEDLFTQGTDSEMHVINCVNNDESPTKETTILKKKKKRKLNIDGSLIDTNSRENEKSELTTFNVTSNDNRPEEMGVLKKKKTSDSGMNAKLELNTPTNINQSYTNSDSQREDKASKKRKKKKNKSNMDGSFTLKTNSKVDITSELSSSDAVKNSEQLHINSDLPNQNRSSDEINVLKKKKKKKSSIDNSDSRMEVIYMEEMDVLGKKTSDFGNNIDLELDSLDASTNINQSHINSDSQGENKASEEKKKKKKEKKSNIDNSDSRMEVINNNNQICINNDESSTKEMAILKKKKKRKLNIDGSLIDITNSRENEKSELNTSKATSNDDQPEEMDVLGKKTSDFGNNIELKLDSLVASTNINQSYINSDSQGENNASEEKKKKKKKKKSNIDNSDSRMEVINNNQICINNDESSTKEIAILKKKKKRKLNIDGSLIDITNSRENEKSELSTSNAILNDNQPKEITVLQKRKNSTLEDLVHPQGTQNKQKNSNLPNSIKAKKLKISTTHNDFKLDIKKEDSDLIKTGDVTTVNMDTINDSFEFALEKAKIANVDKQILEFLCILIPWEVPKSHLIETRTTYPTAQQKMMFNNLDVKMKMGPFTKAEDDIIRENWKNFIQAHGLPDKPELFMRSPNQRKHWLRSEERIKFARYLGRNLENRMLYNIYLRFINIFKDTKKGKFTDEEDQIILCYMKNSNCSEAIFKLSLLLNRSRDAVKKRYSTLITDSKTIKWDFSLKEKLIKVLLEVTEKTEVQELEEFDISSLHWKKVEEKLNVPVKKLRVQWFTSLAPQLFTTESNSLYKIRKKLIKKLYKLNLDDRKSLNWNEIAQDFDGITAVRLIKIFQDLMTKHVPTLLRTDYKKSITYLKDSYIASSIDNVNIIKLQYSEGRLISII